LRHIFVNNEGIALFKLMPSSLSFELDEKYFFKSETLARRPRMFFLFWCMDID